MDKILFDLPWHGPVTFADLLPVLIAVGLVRESAREDTRPVRRPPLKRWAVLLLPLAMLPLIWLGTSGCVTHRRARHLQTEAYSRGQSECFQRLLQAQSELKAKTERLRKFNQVDELGRLRPARDGDEPRPGTPAP